MSATKLGKFSKISTIIGLIVVLAFAVKPAFASNLYLFPSTVNIPYGGIVPVNIGLDTYGESINGVSAYLSYPSDKVEVEWISYGDTFPIQAEESFGNGLIKISRGSITGENGNVKIATIGLKGKTLGTATFAFIEGSFAPRTLDSSDSLNLSESKNGVFTFGMPSLGLNPIVFL